LVIEGKLADAEVEIARIRTIATELGQPVVRWFATYFDAAFRAITGDLEESERLAEEALRIGTEAGQPDAAMIYGAEITPIRTIQDRVGEFIPLFEQAAADNPGLPVWRAALANAYATAGRIDDAAEIVADFARNRFTDVPYDQTRFSALVVLARAVYETMDREAAVMLYELLEPWADAVIWNGANSYPQIRMYMGMLASVLGQDELADENLRAACAFQERAGMRVFAPASRGEWADVLARRGATEAARREAATALELAREVRLHLDRAPRPRAPRV